MNANLKNIITELNNLITDALANCKDANQAEQAIKTALEKRNTDLDWSFLISLTDNWNLREETIVSENSQLSKDKKALEEQLTNLKSSVSDKLTAELISRLERISNKSFQRAPKRDSAGQIMKDTEGNTIYEDLIDLGEITNLLKDLKANKLDSKELAKELKSELPSHPQIPNWAIYSILGISLACFSGIVYLLFTKKSSELEAKEA